MNTEQNYSAQNNCATTSEPSAQNTSSATGNQQSEGNPSPVAPDGEASFSFDLGVNRGIGNSSSMLVYWALRDYKRGMLKYLLKYHSEAARTGGDYSDAISIWENIKDVEDLQEDIASQAIELAEKNYWQIQYLKNPNSYDYAMASFEERKEKRLADYLKEFEIAIKCL